MSRLRDLLDRFDSRSDAIATLAGGAFVVIVLSFLAFNSIHSSTNPTRTAAQEAVSTSTTAAPAAPASSDPAAATTTTGAAPSAATTTVTGSPNPSGRGGSSPAPVLVSGSGSTTTTVAGTSGTSGTPVTSGTPGSKTTSTTTPAATTSTTVHAGTPATTTTTVAPTTTTTAPKSQLPGIVSGTPTAVSRVGSARLLFGEAASNGNGALHYEYDAFYGARKAPTEYLTETGWKTVPFDDVVYFTPDTGQMAYQVRACSSSGVCGPPTARTSRVDVYVNSTPVITIGRGFGQINWSWSVTEYDLAGGMSVYAPQGVHHFMVSVDGQLATTVGVLHEGTGTGKATGFVTSPDGPGPHSVSVIAITVVDGTNFYSSPGAANLAAEPAP